MSDLTDLETRNAHLERLTEELSALVYEQGLRLEKLERRVQLLMEHAASNEASGASDDTPPPHY
ncbi:SlyX family protein [Paracoccaceae bacterium GXU_MW_L88]